MRKYLAMFIALATLGCSGGTPQVVHTWVQDNNLWMEDSANFASPNVSEEDFNAIIDLAEDLYAPIAEEWEETLAIHRLWEEPTVNASAWRDGMGKTAIRMYGGLARRAEITPQGFALVLCHELGHLYGGIPYIRKYLKMAAEGQSDYYGAGWCLKSIVEQFSPDADAEATAYMEKVCSTELDVYDGDAGICELQLAAGQSLGTLLSVIRGKDVPDFETPDPTVAKKTLVSYPDTIQCRLDTYHNGTLGQDRPLCWYKPEKD